MNFSWNLIGNLIYSAAQWAIIVVLAKYDGSYMVGVYSLALAVTAPIFMFTNLQLRQIQITDVNNEYNFGIYMGLRYISTIIAFIATLIFSLFNDYNKETLLVVILIGLSKAIESISDMLFGVLQKSEVMDIVSKSLIIKGILSLIILFVTIKYTNNLALAIFLSFVVVRLVVLLFYDYRFAKQIVDINLEINKDKIKHLAIQSIPLGIVMMLISLNENIPRYFIEKFIGTHELGYFSSIAYIPFAGSVVVSALGQAASPRLSQYFSDNNIKGFLKMLKQFILVGVCLTLLGLIVTLLFSEKILEILYTKEFSKFGSLLVLLMVYFGLSYISSFLGFGLTAMRNFKVQPYLVLFVVFINLIFNALLVPKYGLNGAGYAMVYSSIAQIIFSAIVCYITIKRKVSMIRGTVSI
ncbi:oligosaccharide flippase family protein [Bacillus sp. 7884-1]|uniref:oligosaccharide flippase family protein n=1 Tax=Bacillus sp. 7884-1 TaxID=2021693 RepID=UPI000BA65313|nr:oligosaccharide flippase family protein [Bacillus sp. 7884-1]PAE38166.1 hypothetical protein CHI06_18890 [Bacillus sp. 7884-1]